MPDFDEMKQKVGETAEYVAGQAVLFAKTAGEKLSVAAKIAKLRADILGEHESIRKAYSRIGKLYVENFADAPHDVMLSDIEKVSLSEQRIAIYNEEIERIKSEGSAPSADADVEVEDTPEEDE
ncbi:MAG: hypothetical protein LBN43_02195 [Oscillospiraceae bacterium]|jgi:hypothetical protein|nr:hypothetical protein [Oscillospiraceae bacterium]